MKSWLPTDGVKRLLGLKGFWAERISKRDPIIVLSLPCLAAVCTTRRSVEQRHGLTAIRQPPVHAQLLMLHAVCRTPLAPPEMLVCVPPSLVTYLPMALATPVRAAPVDLLTRPKVNPVTAWLRMNDI